MKSSPGNMLLIGAGGFVGPWITQAALAKGWSVTGLSRRPVTPAGPGYTQVCAEVLDFARYQAELEEADAIVFSAAHIPADFANAAELPACLRVNAEAPAALLGRLLGRPRPFIYLSSAQGYQPGTGAAAESAGVFPAAHAAYYLGSKLLGDIITEHHRVAHGLPAAVLRLASLYGPGLDRGMVARFVTQARAGRPLVLQDGGAHQADLTFVGDVAAAVLAVLARGATGIFNIGTGRATTAREAARLILRAAGHGDELLEIQPAAGPVRPGFRPLDITRARDELGFTPLLPAEGLGRTVREWRAPATVA